LSFLETYLQESFAALQYPFAQKPRACPGGECRGSDENGVRVPLKEGGISVDVPLDKFDARPWREIWISVYGPRLDQVGISWQAEGRRASERASLFQPWFGARHWRVLRFPVRRQEHWLGKIAGLRVELKADPGSDPFVYLRWVRLIE